MYGDEKITLIRADHILGAAQVLVEDAGGIRIAYTGDFRIDDTPVVECDVLVVEATYGSPSCRRRLAWMCANCWFPWLSSDYAAAAVYIFGYHGKLQEIMKLLREADVSVPFVMPERVYEVTKVCEQHGMNLGALALSTDNDGQELLGSNLPCVAFYHMNARGYVGLHNARIMRQRLGVPVAMQTNRRTTNTSSR